MNIAASTEKQTFLNSLLNESAFGKIQSAINLNEEGVWAEAAIKPGAENAVKGRHRFYGWFRLRRVHG